MNTQALIAELENNSRYTLHAHTQFCDAHASMQNFVERAIRDGFTHYGFTPHSPIPIASPCNMNKADVPVYLEEIERLKDLFGDSIKIYAGMEVDYLSTNWGAHSEYFRKMPLDYRIGSVHFIQSQNGEFVDIDGGHEQFMKKMSVHFHNDIDYVVKKFFESTHEMIELGGFEIIGHFDKISDNGSFFKPSFEEEVVYNDLVEEVIDHIASKDIIVEINTKAKEKNNRYFPSERWWKVLLEKNVPLIVNSDVHYVDLINASRDYPLKWLGNYQRN